MSINIVAGWCDDPIGDQVVNGQINVRVLTDIFYLIGADGPCGRVKEEDTFKGTGHVLSEDGIKVGGVNLKGAAHGPKLCVYMADFPVRSVFHKNVHQT